MTLDNAIKHCEEVAIEKCKLSDSYSFEEHKCGEEHQQLAEWLKELKQLREQTKWIPVSERLPKDNEYIGNVRKYYLIQDEYGDMHVAYLNNVGWVHMDSFKAIHSEVIAWMPLPEPYKEDVE